MRTPPFQKILLIDHHDSFTFNLVESFRRIGSNQLTVLPEDQISVHIASGYDKLVFSPGPGLPQEHSGSFQLIRQFLGKKPILGICLGHQILGLVCGAELVHLQSPDHGRQTRTKLIREDALLDGVSQGFLVGLYHSWRLSEQHFPDELEITLASHEGHVLAFRHKNHPAWGLQFHPESFLTPEGDRLLLNYLSQK